MTEENSELFRALSNIVGGNLGISNSTKHLDLEEKEIFILILKAWDKAWQRGLKLGEKEGVYLEGYDNIFYSMIEQLFVLLMGPEKTDIICFWVYNRRQADGTIATLVDENDKQFKLKTAVSLYNFLKKYDI